MATSRAGALDGAVSKVTGYLMPGRPNRCMRVMERFPPKVGQSNLLVWLHQGYFVISDWMGSPRLGMSNLGDF